jgi:2-desacetyl-2-hydroxyethyl bacteriochlorophyllide A dehydrogenase
VGESSIRQPPLVFGHEVSGHVVAIHPDAATDGSLEVGTAVTVNPLISCGHCRYCVAGRQQLCPRRLLLGATLPGSNAEFVRVPSSALLPIPAGLSLAQAATVEPAAFALHAVELSGARPASSALVVGAGAIGLMILQVLGEWGVRERFVVERNPTRLAMAVALGCTPVEPGKDGMPGLVREATGGYGVDVAFDAVGSPDTRRDCLSSVAAGGTVVLVGLHTDRTELPLNTVVRSEINLTGAFAYSPTNFRTALAWLAAGRIGLHDGIVVAPLHDGQVWYERLIAGDATAKVLLQPQAASPGDRQ